MRVILADIITCRRHCLPGNNLIAPIKEKFGISTTGQLMFKSQLKCRCRKLEKEKTPTSKKKKENRRKKEKKNERKKASKPRLLIASLSTSRQLGSLSCYEVTII